MKLYMIVFSTLKPAEAQVSSYVGMTTGAGSVHYRSDGFPVVRETNNCWHLDEFPEGMPRQYRKADEYKLLNNRNGIYMFGQDPDMLIREWNSAVAA